MTRIIDKDNGLTPAQLIKFLSVSRERLRVWNEQGLFGDEYRVGAGGRKRGEARVYSFDDTLLALITKSVLDLTKSRSLEITAGEDFTKVFQKIVADYCHSLGMIRRSADGSANLEAVILIRWEKKQYHVTTKIGSVAADRNSLCQILIRLDKSLFEVVNFFQREVETLPEYVSKLIN